MPSTSGGVGSDDIEYFIVGTLPGDAAGGRRQSVPRLDNEQRVTMREYITLGVGQQRA